MELTNQWNSFIYKLWSPIYDLVASVHPMRKRIVETAALQAGERVIFFGIGTGADLLFLPGDVYAYGIDLSEHMLSRAKARLPLVGREIVLEQGDAQALPDHVGKFDAAVLDLILSVVPNPFACMREAMRVVRPGGRMIVFDKFLPKEENPSRLRRFANIFAKLLGTDINRRLEDILEGLSCEIVSNEPGALGGMYRIITLRRLPD